LRALQAADLDRLPPALLDDIDHALPAAIAAAEAGLQPGDPAEALAVLTMMANRRGLPLPDALALEMDCTLLAELPADLLRLATRRLLQGFTWRRLPEVAEFFAAVQAELTDRREELARLRGIALRRRTDSLRRQWDARAAAYGRQLRQREAADITVR